MRIANDGLVYVADRGNSRVQVFTLDGKYQAQVFVNRKDKSAATACGLALSADSQQKYLYVSDFGNGHVWILDRKSLTVLGHFGEQGPEPGNFRNAHHMTTDSKGNLYTAEIYTLSLHDALPILHGRSEPRQPRAAVRLQGCEAVIVHGLAVARASQLQLLHDLYGGQRGVARREAAAARIRRGHEMDAGGQRRYIQRGLE